MKLTGFFYGNKLCLRKHISKVPNIGGVQRPMSIKDKLDAIDKGSWMDEIRSSFTPEELEANSLRWLFGLGPYPPKGNSHYKRWTDEEERISGTRRQRAYILGRTYEAVKIHDKRMKKCIKLLKN